MNCSTVVTRPGSGDHDALHDRGDGNAACDRPARSRIGLGQHFGEDHDQRRHDDGRVDDTDIAEQIDPSDVAKAEARRTSTSVVAEQNRADDIFSGCASSG
jgi:hypothetical protein